MKLIDVERFLKETPIINGSTTGRTQIRTSLPAYRP